MRKMATTTVTLEALRCALCIPDDICITGFKCDFEDQKRDVFRLRLEGQGLPEYCRTEEGQCTLEISLDQIAKPMQETA